MRKRKVHSIAVSLLLILLMTVTGPSSAVLADNVPAAGYSVQTNDSLYKIAASHLGSGDRWNEIYKLNRDSIKDPSLIYAGQILKLPGSGQVSDVSDEQKEADRYAALLYSAASEAEPYTTAVLKSMESDKVHLEGLEYRLKTVESTSRKILTDAHDMEIPVEEAAKNINDSLRYTFVIEASNLAWRFARDDDALIEISEEEAGALLL